MKQKLLNQFGKVIQELRINIGYSQEKLGEKANLHRTYIGMIERGEKNISLLNIKKIASALNISLVELFKKLEENGN